MKKVFLLSLFVSIASFAQIKINPIPVGYPAKQATDLKVTVLPFDTNAKTCQLYYQLKQIIAPTEDSQAVDKVLAEGNLSLTEAEFTEWSQSMVYIENLALTKLELTRKTE